MKFQNFDLKKSCDFQHLSLLSLDPFNVLDTYGACGDLALFYKQFCMGYMDDFANDVDPTFRLEGDTNLGIRVIANFYLWI